MLIRIYILLVFLSITMDGYAQNIRLDKFDIFNGLSNNLVFDLDIDKTGNIWIATIDGLNKYNGYQFELFKPSNDSTNSINGNIVTSVTVEGDAIVWSFTINGGLNKYNTQRNKFFFESDFNNINSFLQGFNNIKVGIDSNIWVQAYKTIGVYNQVQGSYAVYGNTSEIYGLCSNLKNEVFSYGGDGVSRLDYFPGAEIIKSQVVLDTVYWCGSKGKHNYLAFHNALVKMDVNFNPIDTLIVFENLFDNFNPKDISDIVISDNEVWIGTTKGLYQVKVDDSRNSFTMVRTVLETQHIARLKYDNAGNLWIATTGGVFFYSLNKNQFKYIDLERGHSYNEAKNKIGSICKLKSGDLWYGLEKNEIKVLTKEGKEKSYTFFTDEQSEQRILPASRCIFEDSQNNIWIATWENICRYNKELDRIESLNHKYGWNWPYTSFVIKEFDKGKIVITGNEKIAILDLKSGTVENFPTNLNGVYLWKSIRDIVKDKYNNYWIVQNDYGLVKISTNPLRYERFLQKDIGLSDNKIYVLLSQGDSLMIGTHNGLDILDIRTNSIIKSYTKKDGLTSNVIYSIYADEENNFWVSTSSGICKLESGSNSIISFLQNEYFSDDACFLAENGEIFFGGYSGITSFHPKDIVDLSFKPTPVISRFMLFNKNINVGDMVNGKVLWNYDENLGSKISLNHKQNSISFSFNSYPFDVPSNNRYRYRLLRNEDNWIYLEKEIHNVNFNDLRIGEYNLQLEVSTNTGEWSDPVEIKIMVHPPFWKTFWFRALSLFFIILVVAIIIRLRIEGIKRSNLLLERKVEEQTHELKEQNVQIKKISDKLHKADQAKLRFFTDISHEFRTPITLILAHLNSITKGTNSKPARIISNNAKRLLKLVNDLIDVRKLDQGQLKLNISLFEIVDFTKNIVESFRVIADQKKINLEFYSSIKTHEIWLDKEKLEQIIFNLISNGLKYIPEGRNLIVHLEKKENKIEIIVEDNGKGIPPEDLGKIFDRFYRLEDSNQVGHGIGLSLVKGLVKLQKGEISALSEVNKGTSFILSFKLGKDHFNETDFGEAKTNKSLQVIPQEIKLENISFRAGQKILVVEDNHDLQHYLLDLLQKHFHVQIANNGQEALEILESFIPNLIISDLMMPVMDGLKFCAELKAKVVYHQIPFVLLTAKSNPKTKIDGYACGVDDIIEKPFDPNVLLARIKSLLLKVKLNKNKSIGSIKKEDFEPASFSENDYSLWVKINQIIEDNYSNVSFSKDVLCEKLNMSRSTFQRKFKKLTGQSASVYLRKYRLKKAAEMLYDDDIDMYKLSISSGFKSISQFRINFREEFGKTPAQFRKMK